MEIRFYKKKTMFANNTEVNGYKRLSPDARKDEKTLAEYNELVESVQEEESKYVSISESEWSGYLEKVKNEYNRRYENELKESDAYTYTTPFDFLGNLKLSGIFAPLKWLALLLAGGLALLLAGLYKALKEGKKQLAIAKVRQWIKSLVVLADGGYKKSRKTKDSLFLIQARARRDILQAAVMAGYAAGLDIPEKHNEPVNPTESAKNESFVPRTMSEYLALNEAVGSTTVFFKENQYQLNSKEFDRLCKDVKNNGQNLSTAEIYQGLDGTKLNKKMSLQEVLTAFGKTYEDVDKVFAEEQFLPNNVIDLVYDNNRYANSVDGIKKLLAALKQNGEDINIAQIYYEFKNADGNTESKLLADKAKEYFKARIQIILKNDSDDSKNNKEAENAASQQKKQQQINAVEKFAKYDFGNGNVFDNNADGLKKLNGYLYQNGYSGILPTFRAVDSGQVVTIDSTEAKKLLLSRLAVAKKGEAELQRLDKENERKRQQQQKEQEASAKAAQNKSELSAVEKCRYFVYKGKKFANTAEGIIGLAEEMKNDGYDLKANNKGIPQIEAVMLDGSQVELEGQDARTALIARYTNIKKNEEEMLKNLIPSNIRSILYNNQTYNNDAEGLDKFFRDIEANNETILTIDAAVVDKKYPNRPVQMNKDMKKYLKSKYDMIKKIAAEKETKEVEDAINKSYDLEIFLPNDDQVDWSLLNTIKTSSWFGLVKHKTNLWAEAKSVHKMSIDDAMNETERQKYIANILVNVNASLSKITTPSIARNYTNVINQFVTAIMKRSTKGSKQMMSRDNAANVGIRVGNHGGMSESKSMSEYMKALEIYEGAPSIVPNGDGGSNASNDFFSGYMTYMANQTKREVEIEYDDTKPLIDNTTKAMQNIFTANPVNDFLVFKKTQDQMNNFLTELTKSVYVIIESVAKKTKENNNGSSKGIEGAINSFLADNGDPKQNRSLRNLWDNIGRPQLDSRAITRCFALTQSPEFHYFIDMLCITIPLSIMAVMTECDGKLISLLRKDGSASSLADIIEQKSKKEQQANKIDVVDIDTWGDDYINGTQNDNSNTDSSTQA